MTDPRSDLELITAHRAGDRYALGVLLDRHRRRVQDIAYAVLHDPVAAEDVVQDVAVSVVRHIDGWKHQAKFSTWLQTVARNQAFTALRRRKVHAVPVDTATLYDHVEPQAPGDDHARAEARVDLERLLAHLPAPQAQALRALDLDGLDRRATARRLGVSPVTLSTRANRGRRALERIVRGVPA